MPLADRLASHAARGSSRPATQPSARGARPRRTSADRSSERHKVGGEGSASRPARSRYPATLLLSSETLLAQPPAEGCRAAVRRAPCGCQSLAYAVPLRKTISRIVLGTAESKPEERRGSTDARSDAR